MLIKYKIIHFTILRGNILLRVEKYFLQLLPVDMLIYDLSFSCHASSIVLRKKKQILRMNFRSYE